MRTLGVMVLCCCWLTGLSQKHVQHAVAYSKTISGKSLRQDVKTLASDSMEGRETAMQGQKKSAEYIEGRMKEIGLSPASNGNFQSYFPVFRDSILSASLVIDEKSFRWKKDFNVPTSNRSQESHYPEIVYIDLNKSTSLDFRIQLGGRIVLLRLDTTTKAKNKQHNISLNVESLKQRGAAEVLIIDSLEKAPIASNLRLTDTIKKFSINYLLIDTVIANAILSKPQDNTLLPLQIYKVDIGLTVSMETQHLRSSNVVGLLEGTSRKDECLVISAHYDHMGTRDGFIWPGADDDASGTSAVLALATAFAKAKSENRGPERSILFIAFSGEEEGLWGSESYIKNPAFPLDKTSAVLNIDMIGRMDSSHTANSVVDYVYLIGDDKNSSELPAIIKLANKNTKLELDEKFNDPKDPEKLYTRSDHYNFAQKKVPVVFFYDGGHADYHRVTDTYDKIHFPLLRKRAKLVFLMAWDIANRDLMLKRDKPN